MPEPVRLMCPECELVYRVKKLTLGKEYKCRNCGAGLLALEPVALRCPDCGHESERERLDPAVAPVCDQCAAAPALALSGDAVAAAPADGEATAAGETADGYEASIAGENASAMASTRIIPDRRASSRRRESGLSPESDLARLPRLIEDLTSRLDLLKNVGIGDGGQPVDTAEKLLAATGSLTENLGALQDTLARDFRELDDKVAGIVEKMSGDGVAALAEQVKETGALFLSRLEEYREAQKTELAALLAPAADHGGTTVEVDIDELADRLVAGVRGRTPLLDPESGTAVDVLARVADGLVKEQSANSGRLDSLAEEIRNAVSGIGKLEEWRGDLPARVAEDISRMVDERVVGPVSNALSRQAPAILSDLQDSKLVDIVSRSVREAQRPLLREILSGGRHGVPAWLFASVLIPLLLIVGYLFLPGELGFGDNAARMQEIAETVHTLQREGVRLDPEADARLYDIDDRIANLGVGVKDLHDKALEHASNSGALEQKVKDLAAKVEEREQLVKEYEQMLDRHVKLNKLYEARLIQLGVSPENVQ